MIYAPVPATAEGQWNGRPVDYEQTFANACVMAARTGAVFALSADDTGIQGRGAVSICGSAAWARQATTARHSPDNATRHPGRRAQDPTSSRAHNAAASTVRTWCSTWCSTGTQRARKRSAKASLQLADEALRGAVPQGRRSSTQDAQQHRRGAQRQPAPERVHAADVRRRRVGGRPCGPVRRPAPAPAPAPTRAARSSGPSAARAAGAARRRAPAPPPARVREQPAAPACRRAAAGSGCGAGSSTRSLAHIGTSTTAVRPPYRWAWYQVLCRASSGMLGYAAGRARRRHHEAPRARRRASRRRPRRPLSTGMRSSAADLANGSASPGRPSSTAPSCRRDRCRAGSPGGRAAVRR